MHIFLFIYVHPISMHILFIYVHPISYICVQYEQGYTVQVRHIISTNEDFWYKVKCIISMNKIWSAGKAHHQVLEKGEALIVQYNGLIFPAFDKLYLLIIPVFNTTGNVMYFPS